jgi:hypothetical protein
VLPRKPWLIREPVRSARRRTVPSSVQTCAYNLLRPRPFNAPSEAQTSARSYPRVQAVCFQLL